MFLRLPSDRQSQSCHKCAPSCHSRAGLPRSSLEAALALKLLLLREKAKNLVIHMHVKHQAKHSEKRTKIVF